MSQYPSSEARRQGGFTLIETIVVITIVGGIALVLAAAISVFARNEGSVSTRLTADRDLQNLVNFLPADIASARVVEDDISGITVPGNVCGTGGSILLHIEYSEEWGGDNYQNYITYREISLPDRQIVRYECENGGGPESFVVARTYNSVTVTPASTVRTDGTVEFVLDFGSEQKRITATSRNFL